MKKTIKVDIDVDGEWCSEDCPLFNATDGCGYFWQGRLRFGRHPKAGKRHRAQACIDAEKEGEE